MRAAAIYNSPILQYFKQKLCYYHNSECVYIYRKLLRDREWSCGVESRLSSHLAKGTREWTNNNSQHRTTTTPSLLNRKPFQDTQTLSLLYPLIAFKVYIMYRRRIGARYCLHTSRNCTVYFDLWPLGYGKGEKKRAKAKKNNNIQQKQKGTYVTYCSSAVLPRKKKTDSVVATVFLD